MSKIAVRPEEKKFGTDLGLLSELVVTGRKVGSPEELRKFFSKLAHDESLFREVMDRVLERIGNTNLTESEQTAVEILGAGKVFGFRDVTRIWNADPLVTEPTVPFSEETLKQCAKENEKGADWRLVYVNGFSLRKQEEIRGRNRKNQPSFDPDYTWWFGTAQDTWATQSVETGYRFLNFKKNFSNITWQTQESEIAKLGEKFERAEEQAVAEACLAIFMIKKERLLKDWWHWGLLQASDGGHIDVGFFDRGGFGVCSSWDGGCGSRLGVVLSRKPA